MRTKWSHLAISLLIFLTGLPLDWGFAAPSDFSFHREAAEPRETARRRCREHLWSVHVGRRVSESQAINREIEDFLVLAERSPVYRELSIALATKQEQQIRERIPLSGGDMDLLQRGDEPRCRLRRTDLPGVHRYQVANEQSIGT